MLYICAEPDVEGGPLLARTHGAEAPRTGTGEDAGTGAARPEGRPR